MGLFSNLFGQKAETNKRNSSNLSDGNTVSIQQFMSVKLGREKTLSIPTGPNAGGMQIKASPAPVWVLPSTSTIIPHTSVMSRNEIDKSSWAFIARKYRSQQPQAKAVGHSAGTYLSLPQVIDNHNANGALNA